MSESVTALYDEDVLHGDELPDAALELVGGACGFLHGRILHRFRHLSDLSAVINAVHMKLGAGYSLAPVYFTKQGVRFNYSRHPGLPSCIPLAWS